MKKILYSLLLLIALLAHLPSSGENWLWKNRMKRLAADKDFIALRQEQASIANSLEKVEQENPGSREHSQLQEKQKLLGSYINKATYQEQSSLFQSIVNRLQQMISPR